jgi:hypothetical protein
MTCFLFTMTTVGGFTVVGGGLLCLVGNENPASAAAVATPLRITSVRAAIAAADFRVSIDTKVLAAWSMEGHGIANESSGNRQVQLWRTTGAINGCRD